MVQAPRIFGGGQKKPPAQFEIRLDSPFVVFHGRAGETEEPAQVTGSIVLTNHDFMTIGNIKAKLEGCRKVSWLTNAVNSQQIARRETFLSQEQILGLEQSSVSHRIAPGTHEWRFKFTLPADTPESIEGLSGCHIIYDLSAVVERGYTTKNLQASKHIRVIRTLSRDPTDTLVLEQANADIWANKISYKITIPRSQYIFGTDVTADFILTPIRKGLKIGTIRMELIEQVEMDITLGERSLRHSYESTVCKREMEMPENSEDLTPLEENPNGLSDECYHFQMTLPLAKSLKKCRQSVETEGIKIEHKLRTYINLLNPEGHTSQLLVKNAMYLFISPNLPVGDDQRVPDHTTVAASAAIHLETNPDAPPIYGEHQLDLLYDDINASGYMTPIPRVSAPNSGSNTPFYARSQNPSIENLPSLDAIADGIPHGGASASQLHNRLASLQERCSNHYYRSNGQQSHPHSQHSSESHTPHTAADEGSSARHTPPSVGQETYYPDPSTSGSRQSHSGQNSRRGSNSTQFLSLGADGHASYDMDALSRTPSYNTAVRTPVAPHTPTEEGLPTYEAATSRPPSPQRPEQAHARGVQSSGRTTPTAASMVSSTLSDETVRGV